MDLKMNALVFAKLKGFPYWPGMVFPPPAELQTSTLAGKPGYHCIRFFGSGDFSWIEETNIKSYDENKGMLTGTRTIAFKKACDDLINYIANGYKFPTLKDTFVEIKKKSSSKVLIGKKSDISHLRKKKRSVRLSEPQKKKPKLSGLSVAEMLEKEVRIRERLEKPKKLSAASVDPLEKEVKIRGRLEKPKKLSAASVDPLEKEVRIRGRLEKPRKLSAASVDPLEKEVKIRGRLEKPKKLSAASVDPLEKEVKIRRRLEKPRKLSAASVDPLEFPSTSYSSRPELDVLNITETLAKKRIEPSGLKFGFLGLGNMGSGLVKNLINSKHSVTVWNRTSERCQVFVDAGALLAETPMDVVAQTDITFCCVSDNDAARMLALGNCGAIHEMKSGKAYVEMSGVDKATSQTIADAVTAAGGRYLEARFQGLKSDAEEGTLNLFAAGDKSLYDDCNSCFSAFSKEQTFLGVQVGKASALYLILQSALGTAIVHLSEILFMAEKYQLPLVQILKTFLDLGILNPFLYDMVLKALESDPTPEMAIKNLQKDMHLTLMQASRENRSLPLVAMANEHLKHFKQMGYEDMDIRSVFTPKQS